MKNIEITFDVVFVAIGRVSITGTTDVPDDWDTMSDDDRREYLVFPLYTHQHLGQILYTASRFQEIIGSDPVLDFNFRWRNLTQIVADAGNVPPNLEYCKHGHLVCYRCGHDGSPRR